MAKKRIKKKPKLFLIILIIIIAIVSVILLLNKKTSEEKDIKEVRVVSKIDNYGYTLRDNKSSEYKKLFKKLKEELSKKEVDEDNYAKLITEMFIIDFYSLNDRKAKTDIGGVDFVHQSALDNFILNAEDTYYKYVESNIYGNRKQVLPTVDKVTIGEIKNEEYSYLEQTDENAFIVNASWTYKDGDDDYQTEGTFTFVHDGQKLCLVEITE